MKKILLLFLLSITSFFAQQDWENKVDAKLLTVLQNHREFVSIPNLPSNIQNMYKNISWVKKKYKKLGFSFKNLEATTLPVLFAERIVNPDYKTILFYFHIDGQPVDPKAWNQKDPFIPELKELTEKGDWKSISWDKLNTKINDDWRIFARAAADDKAPIVMFLSALELLESTNQKPKFNIKIIFDFIYNCITK